VICPTPAQHIVLQEYVRAVTEHTERLQLCKRYRKLIARGQHANQVVVAIARELMGFMGAIAKAIPVTP